MPLLNCIVLLASHLVGLETPRAAGLMAGASTVCTVQPNRANANASEHAVKSWRGRGYPSLACDESRVPSFMVTHSSYLNPICDSMGAASGPPDMVTPRDRGVFA